ncbi:ABC-2 type transport system permease protein [Motilibacter rhizosphaerae]|uniref:ABC-2 type transport system permease protein n=1 Tax=Motilibacter rhizosphaerae TaxID=598652 RepID=A0A4Q7NG96_9ACTN|nr:ABC-2 family transporter protein [Motilibacter rhizosphaerae]RZS82845.1 ABC-2 type transport system permease protein [Motilibacter rhizosphaerae]
MDVLPLPPLAPSPLARLRRSVWLYRRCLGAHLRSTLEYEKDFWVLSVAALLTQGVGVLLLSAVFRAIPQFDGWRFWDVALGYALVALGEGVAVLLAQGAWGLAWTVNTGDLDIALTRPYSPALQVLSSQIGMNGLGNLVIGGALLAGALAHVDVPWDAGRVALAAVLLVSALLVKVGLNLATNCAGFWLASPFPMFAFSMHTLGELARFPITIYGMGVRVALTVALPYAFMSFFPASALLQERHLWQLGLLTPLVAAWCLALGAWLFRRGLLRYESAGQ